MSYIYYTPPSAIMSMQIGKIKMLIIGHRGAGGYMPENTLASFQNAISMGVDMLELDVHTIISGEVVVIHDSTVDRTTNGTGDVANYTLEGLLQLNAGNGEHIPLLTEVLDLVNKRMPVNIELKGEGTALGVARIIREYCNRKYWPADLFVVSSFNHEELRHFSRLSPGTPTSYLFDRIPRNYFQKNNLKAMSINVNAQHLHQNAVKKAHEKGVRMFAYTVNSLEVASKLKKIGVDGVFSDFPDRLTPGV